MNPSKNAISQALKIVNPNITKEQLFVALNVPDTMTTTLRYWKGTYNILPWENRTQEERDAALEAAKQQLNVGKEL